MKPYVLTPLAALVLGAFAVSANAADAYLPRVVWDGEPSSQAVIGFSANQSGYVRYQVNNGSWQQQNSAHSQTFDGQLQSHFVRLRNLPANSPVLFQICAPSCSTTYWFRSAPSQPQDLTFVAGGDSRTYRNDRRAGNALVARIRPEFVMFGGDFTDSNRYYELEEWLEDWQLTFSSDVINGQSAKRIYPLLPTVGNHEDNDQLFLCRVFGVDRDQNNQCDLNDTYYALNVAGLRLYTLNTEFRLSGYSSYWQAQKSWLINDLSANASSSRWKVAQYHKPMYPRTSSKAVANSYMVQWAQPFADYRLNLAVESDSHLVKYTYPVVPVSGGYQQASSGTVYIGEGSWGAPTRPADRTSSWIVDQDSFAQFKVIQTVGNELQIRTVPFANNAGSSAVSHSSRESNPLALPTLNYWQAAEVGSVYRLQKASNGASQLAGDVVVTPTPRPTSTPTPTVTPTASPSSPLQNGVAQTGSVLKGEFDYYQLQLPQGVSQFSVNLSGSGDADLYVRANSAPTTTSFDCRPYKNGSTESCSISTNGNQNYVVGVRGYASSSNYQVVASWQVNSTTPTPVISPTPRITPTPVVTPPPVVTPTPVITATPTSNPGSCTLAPWSSGQIYQSGDEVSFDGKRYQARWWTQGANPAEHSGSWDVWKQLGSC